MVDSKLGWNMTGICIAFTGGVVAVPSRSAPVFR